jgi:sulfur-carrier protein adenylyltransferase/sulfurtransferase
MGLKDESLARLRATIPEVAPEDVADLQRRGAVFIDVREQDELAKGMPAGAVALGRGFLEFEIEELVPSTDATVVVICASGGRSLFVADGLMRLGYQDVRSVAGGYTRWLGARLPTYQPRVLTEIERERYSRHLLIPEVGARGQARLLDSRVLLVGAGGLGSPAAFYLAAAGVGTIALVDDDVIERSNLQRQILHTEARVGTSKVASAKATLSALNPAIEIVEITERITPANVERVLSGYDVIVDGTDNIPTRYLVNDTAVRLGIPNVYGAIFRFEGQTSVFWPAYPERRGPCYRCLFPEPPPPELAPSCAEAGVLGVLPGVVGTLMAVETLKILLGAGNPLVGRLLQYDALNCEFSELHVRRDPECAWCGDRAEGRPDLIQYEERCATPV